MKLALGTATFGLDYGINNKTGKITKGQALKILSFATENSIDTIDTAADYGDSEKVIGEFNNSKLKIITKISGNEENIEQFFNQSLIRLNTKKVYGCLIHDFSAFSKNNNIWAELIKLKQEEKVEKIGFSVYYPKEIDEILAKGIIPDIVQIPYNIFDQRFDNTIKTLKEKGVEIHVRSVFLQGLFFKDVDTLDNRFEKIKTKLIRLQGISNNLNLPIASLCLNFVLFNQNIDKVVIGVDSLDNLKQNIACIENKSKVTEIYGELMGMKEDDEQIVLPFNWKKTLLIVQARIGSTRLPGKTMMLLDIAKESVNVKGAPFSYDQKTRLDLVNSIIDQQSRELKELETLKKK